MKMTLLQSRINAHVALLALIVSSVTAQTEENRGGATWVYNQASCLRGHNDKIIDYGDFTETLVNECLAACATGVELSECASAEFVIDGGDIGKCTLSTYSSTNSEDIIQCPIVRLYQLKSDTTIAPPTTTTKPPTTTSPTTKPPITTVTTTTTTKSPITTVTTTTTTTTKSPTTARTTVEPTTATTKSSPTTPAPTEPQTSTDPPTTTTTTTKGPITTTANEAQVANQTTSETEPTLEPTPEPTSKPEPSVQPVVDCDSVHPYFKCLAPSINYSLSILLACFLLTRILYP
ncbi:unnamed protein product [Owenia fusiformis]|uniref:Uncharacterized protein n=1 Tax=Owenia fusiformis TaxID=6347 RepID=A0A8J1XLM1_OWEFU|nr:unnamed protein product [Owenia fusiformis]